MNTLKRDEEIMKLAVDKRNSVERQQSLQIELLEKALQQSESLTSLLVEDKDRVMNSLKREAPKVWRQFQLDVFTELSQYKKRVVNGLNIRLYQTATRTQKKPTRDQMVGTILNNVHDHEIKMVKIDEFQRQIRLDETGACSIKIAEV